MGAGKRHVERRLPASGLSGVLAVIPSLLSGQALSAAKEVGFRRSRLFAALRVTGIFYTRANAATQATQATQMTQTIQMIQTRSEIRHPVKERVQVQYDNSDYTQ